MENIFEKKPADTLKVDNSTIKLTSPVQSVVQRAKSELERINSATDVKPVITASTVNKSKSKRTIKRLKKNNFTKITKEKKHKNNTKRNKNISKKKDNNHIGIKKRAKRYRTWVSKTYLANNVGAKQ